MKFNVKCVRNMLLRDGEVFTVRKWKSKTPFRVIKFEEKFYQVEKIKAVSGRKSIRGYVHKSGFDNVDDWWDAIRNFGALSGYLYHVTLMEDDRQVDFPEFKLRESVNRDLILMQELGDCDKFARQMSNEEYTNARQFLHSDDEQEA